MTLALYIFLGILLLALIINTIAIIVFNIQLHFMYMKRLPEIINPIFEKWTNIIKNRINDSGLSINYCNYLGTAAGAYIFIEDHNKNFVEGLEIRILEKFNDDSEKSADKYVRLFAQEMPLKEQYCLEIYVHVYSSTPEMTNKEYIKLYLQKIKKMLLYKGRE